VDEEQKKIFLECQKKKNPTMSVDPASAGVRDALTSLHTKIARLETDRDRHREAAGRARGEHDSVKAMAEADAAKERDLVARREQALLADLAAVRADVARLAAEEAAARRVLALPADACWAAMCARDADCAALEAAPTLPSALQVARAALDARRDDAQRAVEALESARASLEHSHAQLDVRVRAALGANEALLMQIRQAEHEADMLAARAAAVATSGGVMPAATLRQINSSARQHRDKFPGRDKTALRTALTQKLRAMSAAALPAPPLRS
jgi:chromosome segregation ATPase